MCQRAGAERAARPLDPAIRPSRLVTTVLLSLLHVRVGRDFGAGGHFLESGLGPHGRSPPSFSETCRKTISFLGRCHVSKLTNEEAITVLRGARGPPIERRDSSLTTSAPFTMALEAQLGRGAHVKSSNHTRWRGQARGSTPPCLRSPPRPCTSM